MRILIATLSRSLLGGVEKYLQALIPELVRRGHAVALAYEFAAQEDQPRIDAEPDRLPGWCLSELGLEALLLGVQAWAPDVVYAQNIDNPGLESALLTRYPVALYAHTYTGTCVSGRKCYSWPRIEPCHRQLGAGCLVQYFPRRCGGLNPRTMWQLFEQQSARKARLPRYQAVLVASRHMYNEYQRHGVTADRLHLAPLPIEDGPRCAEAPPPRPLRYRVLFIGRLMDVKGASHLLRAIRLAADRLGHPIDLTIAGNGPARQETEAWAARLGLAVEFTGWVDSERRSQLIAETDLLAVPSLWPEPFGMVGVEAGRLGVPSVGYAVGGIPDWLIPGETGELAPGDPPTVEGLAEALLRAFADPNRHQRMRAGAWEFSRRFSLKRHVEQLESILSDRPAAPPLTPAVAETAVR